MLQSSFSAASKRPCGSCFYFIPPTIHCGNSFQASPNVLEEKQIQQVTDPGGRLNEGEETFLEDVEDGGKEEGKCKEDEQLVCQLPPVVFQDELPAQVNGSCHAFKLLVGFLHRPG